MIAPGKGQVVAPPQPLTQDEEGFPEVGLVHDKIVEQVAKDQHVLVVRQQGPEGIEQVAAQGKGAGRRGARTPLHADVAIVQNQEGFH